MGTVTSLAAHRRAKHRARAEHLAAAVGHPSARATPTAGILALGRHGRVAHLARLVVPAGRRTVVIALCGVSSDITRPPGDLPPCRRCLTGT